MDSRDWKGWVWLSLYGFFEFRIEHLLYFAILQFQIDIQDSLKCTIPWIRIVLSTALRNLPFYCNMFTIDVWGIFEAQPFLHKSEFNMFCPIEISIICCFCIISRIQGILNKLSVYPSMGKKYKQKTRQWLRLKWMLLSTHWDRYKNGASFAYHIVNCVFMMKMLIFYGTRPQWLVRIFYKGLSIN